MSRHMLFFLFGCVFDVHEDGEEIRGGVGAWTTSNPTRDAGLYPESLELYLSS
jgi:hypothetical protein